MKGYGIEWESKPRDPLAVLDNPGEFWVGRVVKRDAATGLADYGHIVGFGRNGFREVVPLIRWSDAVESPVHPENIELL